jgi:hypothetical protein
MEQSMGRALEGQPKIIAYESNQQRNETIVKLIRPSEISSRILSLLDESDERVIIVSPYMKISKWYKFVNKVKERYGIVTSMNLLLSSEINSLEIGYATETWTEYNDLLRFYHRYIHIGEPVHCDTIAGQPAADLKEIMHSIREELKKTAKNSWPWLAGNTLHISTGRNNYRVSIKDGYLSITTRLRMATGSGQRSIQHGSLIVKKVGDLTAMKTEIHPGPLPDILQLSGQAQHTLKSTCITGILKAEAAYIMESVRRFIDAADDLVVQETVNSSLNPY